MNAAPAIAPSLAQLLFDRFAGRRSVYAKRVFLKGADRWGYVPAQGTRGDAETNQPLTTAVIEHHLTGTAETDPIGVYLVPDGDHRVSFAVLDIDNHTGTLAWSEVVDRVRPLAKALEHFGGVFALRSGGGSGIHLVLFFARPEEAAKVRSFFRVILTSCKLQEGPEGLQAGRVEVFPKQDNVKAGEYGNLIALPFARKSVPLDNELQPLPVEEAFDRLSAVADFELIETRGDGRRASLASSDAERSESQPAGNVVDFSQARRIRLDPATAAGVGEGGRDEMCQSWAGKWRREDVPIEEAEQRMDAFCDGCTPPLDRATGREKLHRAYRKYAPGPAPRIETTDTGNADFFARMYGEQVRYDHARKRWLIWAGHWWTEDRDGEITRLAIQAMNELGKSAFDISGDDEQAKKLTAHALKSRNLKPLENLKKLAQDKRPISDTGENWDRDQWTFGVANGVVDLKAGQLRPGQPDDRITMHSAVEFDPDAKCDRWESYLLEMYGGDAELVNFIQRYMGYSLTGNIEEEVLTFHHGGGKNGKSVLLKVLKRVFGQYAHTISFTVLEDWSRKNVPTEIAELFGKRLVVASEADDSAELNTARIKSLGSRDDQRARFLYARSFEFTPTQHYWLAFNHAPKVRDDTEGFWRRVALVPYERRFVDPPADTADRQPGVAYAEKKLDERLIETELPGILAWAVRGCLEWQQRGLKPFPSAVQKATADYRENEDELAPWIEARCVLGDDYRGVPQELFDSYRRWAQDREIPLSQQLDIRTFGIKLAGRFRKVCVQSKNRYCGIKLRISHAEGDEDRGGAAF